MAVEALAAVVLSWLVQVSPPALHADIPTYPEAKETAVEREERYREIARDVAEVVFAESSPGQRRRSAALLVGIAWHESGFAKDVDLGPCAPRRLAIGGCDSGRAKGLWQIQAYEVPSRQDGARLALRLARRSLVACRKQAIPLQLAAYASGTCESKQGQIRSRELWAMVEKLR